jgi:hypothetical protein
LQQTWSDAEPGMNKAFDIVALADVIVGGQPSEGAVDPRISVPGATDAFRQRPLSRASRPFIGLTLKGGSGSGAVLRKPW